MELWARDPCPVTTAELGGLVPEAPLEPPLFVLLLALLAAMWNRQGLGNPDPCRPIVGPLLLSQSKVLQQEADALARRFTKAPALLCMPVTIMKKTKHHMPLKINVSYHFANCARALSLGVRNALSQPPTVGVSLSTLLAPDGTRANWE